VLYSVIIPLSNVNTLNICVSYPDMIFVKCDVSWTREHIFWRV